jgi:hypothetical protein
MKPPIVIGATGGSGTRVVARIVQRAGVFIGTNRNPAEDAREFVEFYDRWINRFVRRAEIPMSEPEIALMDEDFRDCLTRHRALIPADQHAWGWKEPRSIYLVPFFHERFAGMKFIHVLRDGRDMALSANQNQLRKHGDAILDHSHDGLPPSVRAAALWNRINSAAADYGEPVLGACSLRVRFEDLCKDPEIVIKTIYVFLGCDENACPATTEVRPPESIGRWRTSTTPELTQAIHAHAEPALTRFGYFP